MGDKPTHVVSWGTIRINAMKQSIKLIILLGIKYLYLPIILRSFDNILTQFPQELAQFISKYLN